MQVDPTKLTLKLPRSKRLKLSCVVPLSNFAFKFNWRRYLQGKNVVVGVLDNVFVAPDEEEAANPGDNFWAGAYTRPLFSSF